MARRRQLESLNQHQIYTTSHYSSESATVSSHSLSITQCQGYISSHLNNYTPRPQPCLTTTISCKTPTRRSKVHGIPRRGPVTNNSSYDFDYEDDDEEQEGGDVDIENKYYNAKQMKADNPEEAVDEFLGVPALEPEKGEWCTLSTVPPSYPQD